MQLPIDHERRSLIHRPRADALMRERGYDALIAGDPVNVYYLSNFWTVLQQMGFEFASLALLPRDRPEHHALAVSAAQVWRLALDDLDYPARIVTWTAPANWRDWLDSGGKVELAGAPATAWPLREAATLTAIEQAWMQASRRIVGHEAPTAEHALAREIRAAGLARGRVASDDARLAPMLARAGLDGLTVVHDPNLFRRLRVVKSEPEIHLMRIAARSNADACLATVRDLEPGVTMREIEAQFGVETARRGAHSVFIVAGSTGLFPDGRVVRGKPFLVDAVSQYRHYHGDFGRTVVLGEPDAETRRRVEGLRIGWQASFEAIRPGRRYSEVREAGLAAMRKSGHGDVLTVANPHSVGLQHTDEPFRDGMPFNVKDDLVLEENMTLTVDFPHIEVGWGACHLEDLVRVTRDGAEALAAMDEPLVIV
jgi:Xaa-Pro aminopeptidase